MSKGIPGVHGKIKPTGKLSSIKNGEIKESLSAPEVKLLCGSDKYPVSFDVSATYFLINDQSFLSKIQPNILKEDFLTLNISIDLSSNELSELTLLNNQTKLKRLVADKNCLTKVSFQNLISLKHISLCYNNIEVLPDMNDLKKIVYLNFRGNKITGGFENLVTVKTLKYLDFSKNDIDFSMNEVYEKIIIPLQTLPKLQYFNLEANPIVNKLRNFKFFVIHELPKLEFFNNEKISKEERSSAAQLDAAGAFAAKTQKAQNTAKPMRNIILTARVEEEDLQEDDKNQLLEELLSREVAPEMDNNIPEQPNLIHTQSLRNLLSSLDYLNSHDLSSTAYLEDTNELNSNSNFNSYLNQGIQYDHSDPLDDILNYLDDPTNNNDMNNNNNNNNYNNSIKIEAPKQRKPMELASSHSITNAPVAIEDDINYMDLLGDMIPPTDTYTPLNQSDLGRSQEDDDDALSSLLDELNFGSPTPHQQSFSTNINVDVRHMEQKSGDADLDSLLDEMIEGYSPNQPSYNPPPIPNNNNNNNDNDDYSFNIPVETTPSYHNFSHQISPSNPSSASFADDLLNELLGDDFGSQPSSDSFSEMAKKLEEQQQQALDAELAIREQLKQTELESQRRRDALDLQRKKDEEERIRKEEEYRQKLEDDRRKREEEERLLFEQQRRLEEEQRRLREEEEERRLREEEERIRLAKEENERQMNDRIRLLEEEEKRIKLELELKRQAEEDERKRKEEQIRRQKEEFERQKKEEELRKQKEEEIRRAKLFEEEERIRRMNEELIAKEREAQERLAAARLLKLQEEQRLIDEEIEHRRKLEIERKRLEEEEFLRLEADRKRKEEEDRIRREEDQRRAAELQRMKLIEEQQKRALEEEERKLREQLEQKRTLLLKQQQEEDERKKKESEEMLLLLEEERLAEEQQKKRLADEEKRKFNESSFVDSIVNRLSGEDDLPTAPFNSSHQQRSIGGLGGSNNDLYNDPHAMVELSKYSFPYEIEPSSLQIYENLGIGSFGSVSRGIYNLKEVTIKLLKCNLNTDANFLTTFKNEVAALAELKHPNIVDFIGVTFKELSAVCEYIQGTPLFGILRNKGIVLDIKERLSIIQQIGVGLEYLHSQNTIFRGLKSKNVILTSTNVVKMRDYGLHEVKKFVKGNGGIGTPQYDAPEIILDRPYSIAADIFSFGILMWEIFSHQTPYQDMMARQVMVAVTQQNLRPPPPLDCPVVLWRLMNACWADDPSLRPEISKINRIISQPVDQILKYGMTPGSSEPLPRGVDPSSIQHQQPQQHQQHANQPNNAALPSQPQISPADQKIHAVVGQINQMLATPSFDIQSKALKALLNIGKTESNIIAITQSQVIQSINNIFQGIPQPNDLLIEAASRVISTLCESPIAEKDAREKGINQSLVNLLISPPIDLSDVSMVQAIKAITTLSLNHESQIIIRASGAILPLIQCLNSPSDHIRLQSTWAFSNLLEDEIAQEDFYMNGGVKLLLQQLASPNPGIQFRSLVALGNLMTNPKIFPIISKANILPRFLQLLQSKSAPLRLQAVKATERFSRKGTLRDEISKQGGMQSLVMLLDPNNDQELINIALSTLSHFTSDQAQLVNFKRANGLQAVAQLLSHPNPSIQSEALNFFYVFINQSEINKEIARAISFIPKGIGLMTAPDYNTQLTACKAIAALSQSEKCIETIHAGGALAPSVGLLDSPYEDIHDAVLSILSKLLSFDQVTVKQGIMTAAVLPKLLTLLRSMRISIKESAAYLLADLTDNPKAQLYLKAQKALPLFAGIIQTSSDQPLLEKLLFAISNFATNRRGETEEHHIALRESNVFPAIILHLNSENVNIQRSVVKCMLSLCANPENKGDMLRVNAINALRLLSTSSTKALQLASAKCIGFLSS